MEKVSIIIPVYNAEKSIEKCVKSIIYGQLSQLEVLLVDDCSEDNSWNLCQSLSARFKNVQCFQNEENKGVSYTRNRGLDKAKGEYIIFVDSDDWVANDFVLKLLYTAERYKNSLVVCGSHFLDKVSWEERDYLWEENGEKRYVIKAENFFELRKRFHLQQVWNKIFRRELIEKYNVRFDENQNMGEDFQFVLDYIKVSQCKECVVLNEALYYYVRTTDSSLVSQFGLIETENEYKRLEELLEISGKDIDGVKTQYFLAVQETQASHIYSIMRAKNKTKKEKLLLIEKVMKDGQAKKYYYQQKIVGLKEKIVILGEKYYGKRSKSGAMSRKSTS